MQLQVQNNYKKYIAILLIGILCIVFYLKYNIGIPCIFHELTGFYCPGCGLTRAIASIVKLDFYQAFRYNILVFVLIPFFIFYFINKVFFSNKYKIPNFIIIIVLVLVIVFGIVRNIPMFNYLAPTNVGNYNIYMG